MQLKWAISSSFQKIEGFGEFERANLSLLRLGVRTGGGGVYAGWPQPPPPSPLVLCAITQHKRRGELIHWIHGRPHFHAHFKAKMSSAHTRCFCCSTRLLLPTFYSRVVHHKLRRYCPPHYCIYGTHEYKSNPLTPRRTQVSPFTEISILF